MKSVSQHLKKIKNVQDIVLGQEAVVAVAFLFREII